MPGVVLTLCHHEGLPKGKEEELGSISQTLLFHDLPRSGCLGCPGASVQFSSKALKAQLQPWGICSFSSWVTAAQAAKRELVLQKGWVVCHLTVPMGWHTLAKLQTSHELLVLNVWQMEEVAFLSAGNIWVQVKTTVQEWPSVLPKGSQQVNFVTYNSMDHSYQKGSGFILSLQGGLTKIICLVLTRRGRTHTRASVTATALTKCLFNV